MEQSVLVVPDTNVFLHCKALGELPWNLLASNEAEVVLVDPVLAELDHWKDQGNDRRAKRVRRLLPTLRKIAVSGQDVVELASGPPCVRLRLDTATSPNSQSDNDSAIIDAAEAIQERENRDVLVLTRDILLAARCKRRRINCLLISTEDAEWNAQPENPDPAVFELKRELDEFKRQRPTIEVELGTIGGSLTDDAIIAFLPRPIRFERIKFVYEWAHYHFQQRESQTSRGWDLEDYGWASDLNDLDIKLLKALVRRASGPTIRLTVKNSGSINAEDVRIELLSDGGWLLARGVADLSIKVPRPPPQRRYDANAFHVSPPPRFDLPVLGKVDPSEPIWEVEEPADQPRGVARLAVRIPILRHRDGVEVPFRVGSGADTETPGKLVVRISTENTPKPVIRTFRLEGEIREVSMSALTNLLLERKELEISVASRAR